MRFSFTIIILFSYSVLFCQNDYFVKIQNQSSIDLSYSSFSESNNHYLESFIHQFEIESIEAPFNTKDENLQNIYVLKAKEIYTLEKLKQFLEQYNLIEYIEEVPQYELFYNPNDPLYSQQYALTKNQGSNETVSGTVTLIK